MLGVVTKQSADIPHQLPAPDDASKLDVSLPLTNWRVDMVRLSETVRAYAPEVIVADKR